ncbi:MAG TPA: hypothetical protein PKW76_12530 [bacterium]|mgnify:CR=1 FL=1|nr:hypothetical protein [bacterium]HPG46499.1 hypothetical protein [bacterium]HPM98444.1 hypothetical protein [bacterium]
MKSVNLVALLLVALVLPLFGQAAFQTGIHFQLGVPQGEFGDEVDNPGFGLDANFLYNFSQTPFLVGGSLGFLVYGSETRNEPFSLTIPDVTVDVTTSNNILLAHLLLRIQPQQGFLRPYMDGLVGINYLWTDTSIRSEDFEFDDDVATSTNYDDSAFSYGGGGGIMVNVWNRSITLDDTEEKKLSSVFIDFGVHYLKGGKAAYLKKGDVERTENGKVIYHPSESTTDLLNYRLGVSLAF